MWKGMILLCAAGGAAAFWWTSRDPEALQAAAAAKVTRAEQKAGIRQMLAGHDTFTFTNVVLDLEGPEGLPEFRGQIRSQETLVAAYGQVRKLCDGDFAQAECWEVALLEADGRPVELETAPELPGTTDPTSGQPATVPSQNGQETPPGSEETPLAAADPVPETTEDTREQQAIGPEATHLVTRPRINSRSGPGTSNPVVIQLTQDTPLGLLDTRDGWGQFVIISGPAEGQAVWIALSLTAPL